MTAIPRVGLLVPSSNTTMERDFHAEFDGLVDIQTDRMFLRDTDRAAEQYMLDHEALPAAERLATAAPDVIVFGCTSASALHGPEYDAQFRAELSLRSGRPVIGVLDAVIEELRGSERIVVFTPYNSELTEALATSLRDVGLDLVTARGLGLEDNLAIGRLEPDHIVDQVTNTDFQDADTVFCSCTNMRACEVRERIAKVTGRSVVTSNHASIVATRRHLGFEP